MYSTAGWDCGPPVAGHPTDPRVLGVSGYVDYRLGEYERALVALEAAIEAQRQNPYVEPFPTGLLTLGLFRVMAEARLGRTQVARARFAALESQIAQAPPSPERAALVEEARALAHGLVLRADRAVLDRHLVAREGDDASSESDVDVVEGSTPEGAHRPFRVR